MNLSLRNDIYKILIRHTIKCKAHKALARILKPLIAIDPKEKAREIEQELERLS